jgi:hypothetical protein
MDNSTAGTHDAATTNGAPTANDAVPTNGAVTANDATTNSAAALPDALPRPPVASPALIELLQTVDDQLLRPDTGEFIGRDFVRAEIKEFLSVKNRMLVLVGAPGIGKTALAAQLVREHSATAHPFLAHFCGLSGHDNPFQFCSAIAQQLYDQLGEAYTLPQTVRNQQVTIQASANVGQASGQTNIKVLTLNIGGMHPREAFRQLVREPLRAYNEQHGAERGDAPLVIVVDGLDRAWDWDGGQDGNIVSVLADAQDLPPWVNLICTARPGRAVQALRAQAGVRVLNLQGEQNDHDIETYLREPFLGGLPEPARERLGELLARSGIDSSAAGGDQLTAFVRQAVKASQGNFLFVRRYVDAWRNVLPPSLPQPEVEKALLRFDDGRLVAIDQALDATYAATLADLNRDLDAQPDAAATDVLAALAIAFAPLNLTLLACMTGREPGEIQQSLDQRLKPVLETHIGVETQNIASLRRYALYHRGFADYVRNTLPQGGRAADVRAATLLERATDDDPQLRDYSARYRWSHLLRGLDLAAAARDASESKDADIAPDTPAGSNLQAPISELSPLNSIAEIREQVRDPITQAQLLRGLATRALDPAQSDATGSWTAALNCLRAATHALRHSRALAHTRARGWRADTGGPISNEIIELERTLIALGDAYITIARRMDGSDQRPNRPAGLFGRLHALFDALTRFPLTLYLMMVLLFQGVSEIHIPGALQNLGREQDWTVARLYVLAVSAYRRARSLAIARGADDSADEVSERLASLYIRMGAYDAAASAYETLLARPTTIMRAWRQALWRLELGEVLVLQLRPDQAAEVLTSALPIFESQQAPLQKARVLSALSAAHHLRANSADKRGDGRMATTLDDLTIETCRAALAAWSDITTLQGDESASVDSALAVSNIAHQLWRAARSPRMGDEQRYNARALLDTIPERHFPQRFEHPVLRLFRITAAVLLPAYLLTGMLIAVQLPNSVQIRTQTALAFAPPLLDLTRFPNDLIAGKTSSLTAAEASAFSVINLTKLANRAVQLQPSPPRLDPLGTSKVVLIIMLIYLFSYTAFGLAVITFSSPAQFQGRRPGRLILRKDSLIWRGPAGQGSLMDALEWLKQDARWVWARLWQRLLARFGRAAKDHASTKAGDSSIALADIASSTAVDRRAFGYLLHDFSFTVLEPKDLKQRSVLIPGSIVHYTELCDELEQRMHRPRKPFGVDFIRSGWGICFLLTLVYTLALAALLPLAPARFNRPLLLDYSLLNLYVLATPGLLLPLLWWFIAQPLGASSSSSWAGFPLAATALVGAALTIGVLSESVNLATFGLRPDLATPVLAAGFLVALVCYAPQRPFKRLLTPRLTGLVRVMVAIGALAGVTMLTWNIVTTLRWYNALVHGNRLIEQALAPGGCASSDDGCPLIDQAIASYDDVTCLRPSDSDGFAFRGFAYLVKHDYQRAREDFERALGQRPPAEGFRSGVLPAPTAAQRTSLYTNIGAVDTLLARQPPISNSETHYQSALRSYGNALLPNNPDSNPSCGSLAIKLLQSQGAPGAGLNVLGASAGAIDAEQAPVVLQLADACYSRGSARSEALVDTMRQGRGPNRDTTRQNAWSDLSAAIAEYRAVIAASDDATDQELGRRGIAAAWLAISQFDRPPLGGPDRHTALLQALAAYQELEENGQRDPSVYIGQAWSSIQIGAWDSAKAPLAAASALAPDDPTYPALQGLAAWLDSTQYPVPKKGQPSAGYTAAISEALGFYSQVIALGRVELPRAYATRSLLYFSMRNSSRGDTYADADYEAWMRLAIADADQALFAAGRDGLPPERQVGYRYWRGRLSFTLALTWQEKSRGQHAWAELAPLYSSAYQDFLTAAGADLNAERRRVFRDTWIPWTSMLFANATHMQLAQEAARKGDFVRARGELELVEPRPAAFKKWDTLSAPLPDYHFLHGMISLGLSMPFDFPNPLLTPARSSAEADYTQAIAVTENDDIVPQPHVNYPDDSRPAVYQAALSDLDALLERPPAGWSPAARAAAARMRAKVQAQLDAVAR